MDGFEPDSAPLPAQSVHSHANMSRVYTLQSLLEGGEAPELALQSIDSCEIDSRIVVGAFLAVEEAKTEPHVQIAGTRPAQVDHRSQVLFFQRRSGVDSMPRKRTGHVQVQICRGEFNRVAWNHPKV